MISFYWVAAPAAFGMPKRWEVWGSRPGCSNEAQGPRPWRKQCCLKSFGIRLSETNLVQRKHPFDVVVQLPDAFAD